MLLSGGIERKRLLNSIRISFTLIAMLYTAFSMRAQTCSCKEFIYVNEVDFSFTTSSVHKFEVNGGSGGLTEIGSPWYANSTELPFPHGLGTDRNGFLYIGNTVNNPNMIRRLDCAGNMKPTLAADPVNGFNTGDSGYGLYNVDSYGGFLYSNGSNGGNDVILKWDPCTGVLIGKVRLGNGSDDWGFHIDDNGKFYVTNTVGMIWAFTPTAADFIAETYFSPVIDLGSNPSYGGLSPAYAGQGLVGITTDDSGNIYVVEGNRDGNMPPNYTSSRLLKFSPTYMFLGAGPIDNNSSDGGWCQMTGIVYSSTSNRLYTTSLSPNEDCVRRWTTNLVDDGTAIGPVTSSGPFCKGIAILKECCPTSATVNVSACDATVGSRISLPDQLACDGVICDGQWQLQPGSTNFTYNSCDVTGTPTSFPSCATFTLTNATTPNAPCAPYTITVNATLLQTVTAQTIAGSATVCPTDDPAAFTIVTPASVTPPGATILYQWQSSTTSCTAGFTNIPGAQSATYDPGPVSVTTYYRVIARIEGCVNGVCEDISNCVTLTIGSGCGVNCNCPCTSLVSNPSFESNLDDWVSFRVFSGTQTQYAVCGSSAGYIYFDGTGSEGNLFQELQTVIPGNTYTLTFYAGTGDAAQTDQVRLKFLSNDYSQETQFVADIDHVYTTTGGLIQYTISGVCPPWAGKVEVKFATENTSSATKLVFDQVCLCSSAVSCTAPSGITTSQVAATCTGPASNDNGTISLTGVTNGTHYGVSTLNAGSYNGPAFAAATAIPGTLPAVIQSSVPNAGGTYIVRVFNGNNTCFTDVTVTVAAVVCPSCTNPTLTTAPLNPSCLGSTNGSINLTVTGGSGTSFTYDWSNDGPETPDDDTEDLSGLGAGTYTVTVTSNDGCMTSTSVNLLPGAPGPTLDAAPETICLGELLNLATLVTSNTPAGVLTFHLSQPDADAGINALINEVVAPVVTTTYYIRSTLSGSGCFSTDNTVVTLSTPPALVVDNGQICTGGSIDLSTLVSNSGGGTVTYYGSLADAQAAANAIGAVVSPSTARNYYVRSTNSDGCFTIRELTISIRAANCGTINVSGPN
jgi:hypothetical protein